MNRKKILTTIGILIFTALVGISVYVVTNKKVYLLTKADPQAIPKSVKITNISENSFSVSWYTDKPTGAFIKYGDQPSKLNQTLVYENHETETITREIHHFTLKNLRPKTIYYFKIVSNTEEFGEQGAPFSQAIPAVIETAPPPPDPVYGKITDSFGNALTEPVLVYLDLENTTLISSITKTDGSWAAALNNARNNNLSDYSKYDPENETINVLVISKSGQTTTATTTTANDTPVPTIKLGSQNNFASPKTTFTLQTPTPTLSPPLTTPTQTDITISLPANKTFTNTAPTIRGKAPADTTLEITIHSNEIITGTVKTDANGNWIFTPNTPLSRGDHTITLAYTSLNSEKIEKTFTFNVFEEQESQTEILPDAGISTPTVLLLILGVLAIVGFFIIPLFPFPQ
ncbi:MAG: fibronectin type III domain-containing protein [bacterium]|nr:fibronectin type III domain-containing protein [bacterium]